MEHFRQELIAYLDYYNNQRIKATLIALSAHTLPDALPFEQSLVVFVLVLPALVRVKDEIRLGLLQQPTYQGNAEGLAACSSQTTSPFGCLNNFFAKLCLTNGGQTGAAGPADADRRTARPAGYVRKLERASGDGGLFCPMPDGGPGTPSGRLPAL